MLKTNNTGRKILVIVALILLVGGLVITALAAVNVGKLAAQVECLCFFAALIYAAYYILSGYSKNAAKYFKTYCGVFAVAMLAALAANGTESVGYFSTLFSAIAFALVLILMLSKDLGKELSMYACCGLIACLAVVMIFSASAGADTAALGLCLVQLILGLTLTLMTVAKYIDKAARGTK